MQADAELSRDGSVRKEFESRLPPTHCDPWKSEQVPSTVPSLAIDMHDVLLAHQPQPELAKHVPQDGRLSHAALAASTCANASRAVLKPMTGYDTRSERGRRSSLETKEGRSGRAPEGVTADPGNGAIRQLQ